MREEGRRLHQEQRIVQHLGFIEESKPASNNRFCEGFPGESHPRSPIVQIFVDQGPAHRFHQNVLEDSAVHSWGTR